MNKQMYLPVLLLLLIFSVGCENQANIVEPQISEQNGDGVFAKRTILNQIDEVIPFALTLFVPCANGGAGEDVTIAGTSQLNIEESLDGNGGFHYRYSSKPIEVAAMGQKSGDVYRDVGGKERQTLYIGTAGLPVSTNFTANYNFHGPNSNFRVKIRATLVLNANGELTSDFYSESIDCN